MPALSPDAPTCAACSGRAVTIYDKGSCSVCLGSGVATSPPVAEVPRKLQRFYEAMADRRQNA